MHNSEARRRKERQKEQIKQRYNVVIDPENYEYIPAKKQADYYDNDVNQRVAIYVRVSTDDVRQTTSYELQKKYYEEFVTRHPNWTLVNIYADEGISGTSLKHRDEFNRMIADCKAGKIDMIVTKSVSRFARNVEDFIGTVRSLAERRPPVGVFFESEAIFSLNDDSQMALTFQATMAEEESHTRSRSMETSLRMRLDHGVPLTPKLFGYTHDADGHLQINPEEAREMLEPFVKEGKDVLHLGFSSGLSGTCNSMRIAAEELAEDYPEAKIIVIDTLCACLGEGLLLYYALKLKEEGKTIDEIAKWAEENKLHVCHNVTVDDLNHLQRGGRISKAAAVLGTLVQVKPIIHMDNNGKLQVIAKERGRKKSLNKIVDMAVEQSKGWENEIIMITHGDCLKDAEYVAGRVREKMGIENILINNIGTVIGSHTGPGVVAVFCMGNER